MFALSNVAYVTYEDAAHVVAEPSQTLKRAD